MRKQRSSSRASTEDRVVNTARIVVFAVLLAASFVSAAQSIGQIPLPQVEKGAAVELRVAYVYNPRLQQMSLEQLDQLLEETRRYAAKHFEVELVYRDLDDQNPKGDARTKRDSGFRSGSDYHRYIVVLFDRIDRDVAQAEMRNAYNFRDPANPRRVALVDSVENCLAQLSDEQVEEMRMFARPYLPEGLSSGSLDGFAASLVETQLSRLAPWLRISALDEQPVIDARPFNEWSMWVALGYAELPYDIILTNQLLASTEYHHCSAHTIIRGGISVGGTSFSRTGLYCAYVFLSTYPFTSNNGTLPRLRGDDVYTPQEAARFAGAYLTHEVGHLLFHFGHPFGRTQCVMNPSTLLIFRGWYDATYSGNCAFESHPQMIPGAFRFLYKRYQTDSDR